MDKVTPTATFGFALLQEEIAQKPKENVLVSPVSVSVALGMVANGAKGDTLTGIAKGLGLSGVTDSFAAQNAGYAALLNELKGSNLGVKLSIANSIFAQSGVEFDKGFLGTCCKEFKAQVDVSDFADLKTLETINKWCSDKTNGKINSILDEIDPLNIMYLLNAVYFKGEWTTKFDKSQTSDGDFAATGGTKKHPLMFRNGDMEYSETAEYQLVALPFGTEKRIKLYIFLPAVGKTPADLVKGLDEVSYTEAIAGLYERDGALMLPRFKLEYGNQLNASLEALGMQKAFTRAADFSGMGADLDGLHITDVQHKTVAAFDEDGGEAAAVTSVGGFESFCAPWEMTVNRPFVAVLGDVGTGAVLVAGVVYDP